MNRNYFFLFFLLISIPVAAQKKALTANDLEKWNHIRYQSISNNGNWVSYESDPEYSDGNLIIINPLLKKEYKYKRGGGAKFSANSDFIAFKVETPQDSIRKLKLKKVEKDKFPKDSLFIKIFATDSLYKIANLNSFQVSAEQNSLIAYLYKPIENKKDTTKKQEKDKEKDKKKKDKSQDTYAFDIFNPITAVKKSFKDISEFSVSRNGETIGFIESKKDSLTRSKIFIYQPKTNKLLVIDSITKGTYKKITSSNTGKYICWLTTRDTTDAKIYALNFYDIQTNQKSIIADTAFAALPKGFSVSENGTIRFARNDSKLYFYTAPKPVTEPKDTIPDDEKPKFDLWHWNENEIQPQQLKQLDEEKKRSYLAVYRVAEQKIFQIADLEMPQTSRGNILENDDYMLGSNPNPYKKQQTWEGSYKRDIYLIDLKTGTRTLILKAHRSSANLSDNNKYVVWYNVQDSSWYSYSVINKTNKNITKGLNAKFYNDEGETPSLPGNYDIAGWTANDEWVLINDQFNIWQIDPTETKTAVNITNQAIKNLVFRHIELDPENTIIPTNQNLLLSVFNKTTKQNGFANLQINKKNSLKILFCDNHKYNGPIKAKNSTKIIWQKMNVTTYPDILYSDLTFNSPLKISDANPQQKDFNWATAELVNWTTEKGNPSEGILYKPENFDPSKKYPVMIYYYEQYSDNLFNHGTPRLSHSTINPIHYVSNGYVVFVPDIHYTTGQPGQDAYEYIMSGVKMLEKNTWFDKDHVGLQGQSWGGYQTLYLITQTPYFKAAMAGAPVSNMTSAYGGIRWESGVSRIFQYETGQSRIGGTLWDKTQNYLDNSPVFMAPKIVTPLFVMSNDNDGAVPWYQGIEIYMAMRRLEKPCWLINYNGEPHNLKDKSPNCKDLTIRMMQFFDTFLKEKPAPEWIKNGIQAIEKGKTNGFETSN